VNPLRSVGGTLALALLLVVAGALAIVYVVVVPSYERSLVDARLDGLDRSLQTLVSQGPTPIYLTQKWVDEEAAPLAGARVVVLEHLAGRLTPYSDSEPRSRGSRDVVNDRIALQALERESLCTRERVWRCLVRGTVTRGGERYAEAAYPLGGAVVLLSSPLRTDLQSVPVVRKRVIVAGALATAFAIVLGYALATLFARRIRRLDRAAARIADGDFEVPVSDPAPDELGQLARSFERMRLRLATLDRARAEFIANASHELRTPLFSLGGFLELLASEDLDAETRADFMAQVRGQVSRLTKLATDLLDLSRMDAGRLRVRRESLDLAPLGELLADEFGPRARASGHVLELDAAHSAPALGDEERVLQIGRVLVENALVHTPPGTVVELSVGHAEGGATLSVADGGPGIPAEAQPHVFERFYRLEGTVASGSGLGLAIARELATLMGGRIELDSRPGATRFTLVLAAEAADLARVRPRARRVSSAL
jgi:signal transduction histidine kinase